MRFGNDEKPIIISDYRGRGRRGRLSFGELHTPEPSFGPHMQTFEKFSLIFHGILSLVLIFVIEWLSRHSFSEAWHFATGHPLVFLYNAMLVFVTLLIPYLFYRRFFFRIVISVFWLLLGIINSCVLASRVTPFNFTDLKLVGDLLNMKNSKYVTAGQTLLIIIGLILLAVFLVWFFLKGPSHQDHIPRIRNLIILAAAVAAVPFITKGAIHAGVLAGYFGNLAQGYSDYGFAYCFAASVVDTGVSKPVNYSDDTVQLIKDSIHTDDTAVSESDIPNIIFVQLESFIDPGDVNFLTTSEDPIPNYHYLQKHYSTGYLTVPVVGAGTSNTEFEILTGMAIQYFGLGEYPYKTVLKSTPCESIASDLSQIGYATHALHNNGGNFYSRAKVFSNMGFDTFTSKELMNIQKYNEIGTWPTDDILVGETNKILDSTPDQSDFLYTITVQSHGSYPTEKVFSNPAIKVSGASTEEKNNQWEYYVNEVSEVDQFIGNLIEDLSKRDEKTIVVLYGDHLPTMGLENSNMKSGDIYKTRYVTWNNFGLEKQDQDVTSYQLMAHITDQLGIHEGTFFRYHQSEMEQNKLTQRTYMSSLKILQYDVLYGKKYVYDQQDLFTASDMEMGVQDVVIERCALSSDGTKLNIYGKNFTPWSKIYLNGKKTDTEYLNSTVLQISLSDINDGDSIVVNQLGSSDTIFRSSNTLTWSKPLDTPIDTPAADPDKDAGTVEDTTENDLINGNNTQDNPTQPAVQIPDKILKDPVENETNN